MSQVITQYLAERWRWGILKAKATTWEIVNALNVRLGKLSETLERIQAAAEFGPVPGAYFPVYLYCDTPDIEDGIAYTYLPQSYQGLRIISASASISDQSDASADLDINIKAKDAVAGTWSNILTATPATISAASPMQRNAAGDFSSSFYAVSAFRVDCADVTNIPKGLMVLLTCKNLGKIEPA